MKTVQANKLLWPDNLMSNCWEHSLPVYIHAPSLDSLKLVFCDNANML